MADRNTTTAARHRPTIKDVAQRANVSKSLVSLVLHGSSKVSEKSRTAVLQAIDELGYRPSGVARSLVTGRTDTVGILVSDPRNEAHTLVMHGIQESTSAAGSRPLIMHGRTDPQLERQLVDAFLDIRVDGLIFLGSELPSEQLTAIGEQLPVAIVGRRLPPDSVDVVVADSRTGARLAVEHLVELGHRRIAHIDATLARDEPQCRAGYLDGMEHHGLTPIVVAGSLYQEGGEAAAQQLLDLDDTPTAIFAASDLSALGAREVLEAASFPIPERISLVGYNDSPFARLHGIDLTSVREPSEAMGIYASEVVANRIQDPSEPTAEWVAEPELVIRSSTQAPKP
jgi:DNA-binding LacI/PurR family transcriptional regulator